MGFTESRKTVGLYTAEVIRRTHITPHMIRVTIGGEDLARLPYRGYDHWFRLFMPRSEGQTDFAAVPDRLTTLSYLRYLTAGADRPPFRNYTVRSHRAEAAELDIDFVAHGEHGIAGPWAQRAEPGERIAFIDQGLGFDPLEDGSDVVLVGEESALPAIAGILRDLPAATRGVAMLEIPSSEDVQPLEAPAGVEVRWLPRMDPRERPGVLALETLQGFLPGDPAATRAYVAGEQRLATEGRRHLVAVGVPKPRIAFTGYWRHGKAS